MNERTTALRALMREHKLTARQAGALVGREPHTVRCWRCEGGGRVIPLLALENLQMKLSQQSAA